MSLFKIPMILELLMAIFQYDFPQFMFSFIYIHVYIYLYIMVIPKKLKSYTFFIDDKL